MDTMMPLTQERLTWVDTRILTLALMIREFTFHQSRYQSNPRYSQYHSQVMGAMIQEQLQLNIEKNVITESLIQEREARIAAEQERINDGTSRFTQGQ